MAQAHGRPGVRRIRSDDPPPRAEVRSRAGHPRHLPRCVEGGGAARTARPRAPRPHRAGPLASRPDSQARGRHGPSRGHGRPHISRRRGRPVRAHGGGLGHSGRHGGGARRLRPRDGMLARMRGRGGAMSHGDRGSQRASAGPAAWAAAHDAGPSVGRAGGCHGNAAAGSLLGTVFDSLLFAGWGWYRFSVPFSLGCKG
jgi:hypothetical protein